MSTEPAAAGVPTDEDVLVAVEEALEGVLLPDPGFGTLEAARTAVLDAVGPLVARLRQAPAVPVPPPTDQTALRDRIADRPERYAVAIHDAMEPDLSLVDQEPGQQALFARAAEAVVALADSEQATLRRKLAAAEKIRENADFHLGQEMARRQLGEKEAARLSADRAAVLNAAAQHLYTALFPAVYDDMGQKAAEGVQRAVSELRRLAAEAISPWRILGIANCQTPATHNQGCACTAAGVGQDGAQPSELIIVAYRASGARVLRCRAHAPSDHTGFTPLTAEDLPDGGICTYPECGVDVLMSQEERRG
ncbi:hypothetical protein [Streptomyces sp. NPDC012510]|uniref:hypothetical protein n=1 Tax=Streptomyces sp. NPDC012510 TaxID=3364838 RepID=UPI0036EBBE1F